jgi:hypothetical protein
MARYDYGLRGPRETASYDRQYGRRGPRYDFEFGGGHMGGYPPPNRVTARYNEDYVRDRGPMYPLNPFPYGGDSSGRVMGPDGYFSPYMTRAGSWTTRGTPHPGPYDRLDFGPPYRGRYPDEL